MKRVWNKLLQAEQYFIIAASILFMGFGSVAFFIAIYNKTIWSLGLAIVFFLLGLWLRHVVLILNNFKFEIKVNRLENEKLLQHFNEAVMVCNQWEKYTEEKTKELQKNIEKIKQNYISNVNVVIEVATEGSELLPQQLAMLSNLTNNMVQASTIKVLLETSKQLDNNTTLIMIQMDHEKSNWNVKITGRSIELDQALQIMDRVKQNFHKMAENNSLVKKTKKIKN